MYNLNTHYSLDTFNNLAVYILEDFARLLYDYLYCQSTNPSRKLVHDKPC